MDPLSVRPASVEEPDVAALVSAHFDLMRAMSPADSCHVLPVDALCNGDVVLFVAEEREGTLGVGGLKVIGPDHGEIKSMHTTQEARGRGVARAILSTILRDARTRGLARLSLETGSAAAFAPARALYVAAGFTECPPFADYRPDPLSIFMTRAI